MNHGKAEGCWNNRCKTSNVGGFHHQRVQGTLVLLANHAGSGWIQEGQDIAELRQDPSAPMSKSGNQLRAMSRLTAPRGISDRQTSAGEVYVRSSVDERWLATGTGILTRMREVYFRNSRLCFECGEGRSP